MQKQPNKTLIILGFALLVVTPLAAIFLTPLLAPALCVPQEIKGTQICLPDGLRALLITSLVPFVAGTLLIVLSFVRRK